MAENDEILAIFSDPANEQCICIKLRDSAVNLDQAEAISVSQFSPGPVVDEEILARQVFSPHDLDPDTRTLTTAALSDARTRGLSVDRLDKVSHDTIHSYGLAKAAADNHKKGVSTKKYEGFVSIKCGNVRAIRLNDRKQFYVFDTATKANPFHADICHGRFKDDTERKHARVELMRLVAPLVPPKR
jgi:hypothetical protein